MDGYAILCSWWVEMDSNHRRANPPRLQRGALPTTLYLPILFIISKMVLAVGFEPTQHEPRHFKCLVYTVPPRQHKTVLIEVHRKPRQCRSRARITLASLAIALQRMPSQGYLLASKRLIYGFCPYCFCYWHRTKESNLGLQSQSLARYHYTSPV